MARCAPNLFSPLETVVFTLRHLANQKREVKKSVLKRAVK
jgi:hypothetical protein